LVFFFLFLFFCGGGGGDTLCFWALSMPYFLCMVHKRDDYYFLYAPYKCQGIAFLVLIP